MKKQSNTQNKGKKLNLGGWIVRIMVAVLIISLASVALPGFAKPEASKMTFYVYVRQTPNALELNLSPIFDLNGRLPENMKVALFLEADPAEQYVLVPGQITKVDHVDFDSARIIEQGPKDWSCIIIDYSLVFDYEGEMYTEIQTACKAVK